MVSHKIAALVARVIHDEGDFGVRVLLVNLFQERDDTQGVDIPLCFDADEFLILTVDGPQDAVLFAARRSLA